MGPCPRSSPSLQPLCPLAMVTAVLTVLVWVECAAEWPQSVRE